MLPNDHFGHVKSVYLQKLGMCSFHNTCIHIRYIYAYGTFKKNYICTEDFCFIMVFYGYVTLAVAGTFN